ncbi:hypothetical protein [Romboutsia ilealis]|uniref:hypothetical protein n=1 Tax=Romboutsia ilealis TaxID=1115758 RepID=UPI0025712847|nr:hypothetical protein [Romboutsia ilealis]
MPVINKEIYTSQIKDTRTLLQLCLWLQKYLNIFIDTNNEMINKSIKSINLVEVENNEEYISYYFEFIKNDDTTFSTNIFNVYNGKQGIKGDKGDVGRGIQSIVSGNSSTSGQYTTTTINVNYTDGTSFPFEVLAHIGEKGDKGDKGERGNNGAPNVVDNIISNGYRIENDFTINDYAINWAYGVPTSFTVKVKNGLQNFMHYIFLYGDTENEGPSFDIYFNIMTSSNQEMNIASINNYLTLNDRIAITGTIDNKLPMVLVKINNKYRIITTDNTSYYFDFNSFSVEDIVK